MQKLNLIEYTYLTTKQKRYKEIKTILASSNVQNNEELQNCYSMLDKEFFDVFYAIAKTKNEHYRQLLFETFHKINNDRVQLYKTMNQSKDIEEVEQ